ncbi:MAG: fibronectin type III domain-containing protein [Gemmatimonadota bacterium]|nr:fibronectin type III domain-containing protein [Gemmatimonadota bacterium]
MFRKRNMIPHVATLAVVALAGCGDDDPDPTGVDTAPAAPTISSVSQSGNALVVSWSAVNGADAYDVQRQAATSGASFSDIATDVTETEYTDDGVSAGTTYNYRVIAKNSSGSSDPSDPAVGALDPDVREAALTGEITGDRELSADTTYFIQGIVTVVDGASLTVPAGTLLLGDVDITPSALIVRKGGKLFSNGTADAPVVFTSENPEGERSRGDWGGVVLNGRSLCNFPADECVGEGSSGPYGGDVLDDDSGRMVYTRIEFAGFEVSFGNELNALTLNGVGSGTELHHLQTHYGSDDGFEWFGGTVDAKYLLSTGISDDSFDYSTGWQGRGQFWIAQQDPDNADNGFEVDGNSDDFGATPFTDPTLYNVTLVGKGVDGAGGAAGESTQGMVLRRGAAGDIRNAIVVGFGTVGLDVDNQESIDNGLAFRNSIVGLNALDIANDDDGIDEDAFFTNAAWNNRFGIDPMLAAPFDRASPDFRPEAGSPALNGFATPPDDGFFEAVDFIGGVDPDEATPWYQGWTTQALN